MSRDEPEPVAEPSVVAPQPGPDPVTVANWAQRRSLTDRRTELLSAFVARCHAEGCYADLPDRLTQRYGDFTSEPA